MHVLTQRLVIFSPDGNEWAMADDLGHARGMVEGYAVADGYPPDGWTFGVEFYSLHAAPARGSRRFPLACSSEGPRVSGETERAPAGDRFLCFVCRWEGSLSQLVPNYSGEPSCPACSSSQVHPS